MRIIGSLIDFEAMSTRVKMYTEIKGSYIEFKFVMDDKAILQNKIKVATFQKWFDKLSKVNEALKAR